MLRLTLLASVSLLAVVGILATTAGEEPDEASAATGATGATIEVARARTDTLSPPVTAAAVAPAAPGSKPDGMAQMTAGVVAGLARATGAPPAPAPAPAPAPVPPSSDLDALTQAVLASLGAPAAAAAPERPDLSGLIQQSMQADTGDAYVAALLAEARGAGPAAAGEPTAAEPAAADLATLIDRALAHEGSDAYIDELLNEAAESGRIAVPSALRTPEGRFDTATLIADIVQKAGGTPAPVQRPTLENAGEVAGVEVRVVQGAERAEDALFYTVQSGDSLGAIARRFYGDASRFTQIFEANRRVLSSPDRIRVGQRLVLPEIAA